MGRAIAATLAVASAAGVGAGLGVGNLPSGGAGAPACGGTERWPVKVGNDPSAAGINPTPQAATIAELNALAPGPLDQVDGRMPVEKNEYTVHGFVAFFKQEADGDYHVVLTDGQGGFASGKQPGTGHSVVVELPDPSCLAGKSGAGSATSRFGQQILDARTQFEAQTKNLDGSQLPPNSIAVTVTGVAFFDFYHGQTGHSVIQTTSDGRQKVIELHPVLEIAFPQATTEETD